MLRRTAGWPLLLLLPALLLFTGCDNDKANRVVAPPNPELLVSPATLNFGETGAEDTLFVTNAGDGIVEWSLETEAIWLILQPDTGMVVEGETDTVIARVNRAGMERGLHENVVTAVDQDDEHAVVDVRMIVPLPAPFTLVELDDVELSEDQRIHFGPYTITYDSAPSLEMQLFSWPGDYALEILLFDEDQYTAFETGGAYETFWNEPVNETGSVERAGQEPIPAGTRLYLVIDNSDFGDVPTDNDAMNDSAVFDFTLILTPQE